MKRARSQRRPARPGRSIAAALAVGAAGLLACWPLPVAADSVAFSITDDRITESSGLARDVDRGWYWTVNDSGDRGRAFALRDDGSVAGTMNFRADPVDVEAVAMSGRRLYVADIGDNGRSRDRITVYFFDRPSAADLTVPYRAYDFRYPDGPHDAEALLVDRNDRLYVVTKEARGAVYAAPRLPSRARTNTLRRVADAPPFVTDGTFLPDERIALRTYTSVEILNRTFQTVGRAATPPQPQGESLTLSLDGRRLLVGSEGRQSTVHAVAIPQGVGKAPAPGASPPRMTPTPTPAPTPPAAEEEPAAPVQATGRQGTWMALGTAALLAAVAGVMVAAVGRQS